VSYSFTLAPGSSLPAGSFTFAAQYATAGITHATGGDTYTLRYVSGGQERILVGPF
jgi:hypothetical protein